LQENSNHSNEWQGCRTLVPAFATDPCHPVSGRGYAGNFRNLIFVFMLGARQNFFRKLAHKFGFIRGVGILRQRGVEYLLYQLSRRAVLLIYFLSQTNTHNKTNTIMASAIVTNGIILFNLIPRSSS
jgi:hypothetical protein